LHFRKIALDWCRENSKDARYLGAYELRIYARGIQAWVDCPRCGRRLKLRDALTVPSLDATLLMLKAPYLCERCGSPRAFLVLERQPRSIH
jgi:hypothetical protein